MNQTLESLPEEKRERQSRDERRRGDDQLRHERRNLSQNGNLGFIESNLIKFKCDFWESKSN